MRQQDIDVAAELWSINRALLWLERVTHVMMMPMLMLMTIITVTAMVMKAMLTSRPVS